MSRRHLLTALLFGALLLSVATLHAVHARAQEPAQVQAQIQADVSYARIVRLSYVEGDVQVWRPEEEGWEQALLNLPIQQGYALATNQGRAEIEFESGATARMAENTILRFSKMYLSDGNRFTELSLQQGSAIFYANLAKNDQFLVRTQHLSVLVPSNARFRVDATPAGAWVTVHKGDVTVETAENSYRVAKNRTLHFAAIDERVEIARAESQDAFDRWAADREEVILAGRDRSTRYVNTQGYGYGVSDLSSYGGWYNVSGYGYGWRPYGVTLSWMPYMHGTWRYIFGYGWTWVSHEPWGWLPYHYGNWVYSPAMGWLWIPDRFNRWCGARVFYVWHNNRMHWGPLNPHDRPGLRPHNLPHGTVTTGIPAGYSSVSRFTRADLGPEPGMKVFYEAPAEFADSVNIRRPNALRARPEGVPGAPSGARDSSAPGAVAPGTSVPRWTSGPGAGTVPARGNDPQGRAELPTPRRAPADAGAQPGITYDPETRRYVNNAPPRTVPNPDPDTREGRPTLPRSGDGNVDAAPKGTYVPQQKPGMIERRGAETEAPLAPPPVRVQPRAEMPGPPTRNNDVQPRYEQPRYESRPTSPPPSSPPPRVESPRPQYTPPPRGESPRPSSPPPRVETPRPSPPPRVETPRSSSPPPQPRSESSRPSPPPRPTHKPGGGN